jgi:tetratricopeptide (TPR) repeat protein
MSLFMRSLHYIAIIFLVAIMVPRSLFAQEEESAAISLEDNTDVFQELFFEALMQKGIENYGKAINALLKCKQLATNNDVVDHELAKTYQLNNQLVLAEEYAREAIVSKPDNLWYLNTLVEIRELQGTDLKGIKEQIPYSNIQLKENLAQIYFEKKRFDMAREVIKDLRSSKFTRELTSKIQDSITQEKLIIEELPSIENIEMVNPVKVLTKELNSLLEKGEIDLLNQKAEEALETYPAQPFFYYAKGAALNRMAEYKEAIDFLMMGLDFVFDNDELSNKFYGELAKAYTALGETTKANTYLSKIKNGS